MLTSVCMPLQKLKFISALWISAGWALFLRPGSGLESCWACHSLLALSTTGSCSLGLLPPGTTLCSVRLHALSKAWAYTFPGSFPGFQNSVAIPGTWVNNTLQDWVQRQQQCRDMSAAMILPCPIKHTIPIHLLLKVALKPWLEQAYRQGEAFYLEDPRNADCRTLGLGKVFFVKRCLLVYIFLGLHVAVNIKWVWSSPPRSFLY